MLIAEVAQPIPLHRTFDYAIPQPLQARAVPGVRVRAPFGPTRRLVGVVMAVREGRPERPLKLIDAVLDPEPIIGPEMLELAVWMSKRYGASLGECCKAVIPSFIKPDPFARSPSSCSLAGSNRMLPLPSKTGEEWGEGLTADFQLTQGQERALKVLQGYLRGKTFKASLLFGVPASGKTEVYLRLIREAIGDGGQALYLLPEISLTQPFFDELSRRAGFSVAPGGKYPPGAIGKDIRPFPMALWHSRLGIKERRSVWLGLKRGDIQVVVGARSACLLPFRNLRLSIVDEEQDESFKQDAQAPLYHTREVVLERSKRAGALAVFGSATPSMEAVSYVDAGAWTLLEMPERISALERPCIEMTEKPAQQNICLSGELLSRIRDSLKRQEQVILLVNRRGFSNFMICRKCGWVARCPGCALAYIHHEKVGEGSAIGPGFELRCHHCGRCVRIPEMCGGCHKPGLAFAGVGTQKVVAEVKSLLPGVRVLRMDRDSVSKKGTEDARIYEQFKARKADILVGTKLVAKGFHFPDVTLVGVVDADTMLHMPDFRSAERTVQVLLQAAGRAGRAEKPGFVLLQTAHPEHYALQAVARGDYLRYARRELEFRRELSYPPVASLVRLVVSGRDEKAVASGSEEISQELRARLGSSCEVLGPVPAVYQKLRGRFRYHVLVKIKELNSTSLANGAGGLERLGSLLADIGKSKLASPLRMQIQVDPYDLF